MQNRRNLTLSAIGIMALAVSVLADLAIAPQLRAQSLRDVPQWQIDAGGHAKFDVASVKKDTAAVTTQTQHTNIPVDATDGLAPTGGLYSATNVSLQGYMRFAYKLPIYQVVFLLSQLPKWAKTNRYDIQARAPSANQTKDQMRLMLQALLADRFKLAVHWETRQVPGFALVLDKPGKLGPRLRPHSDDAPCSIAAPDRPFAVAPPIIAGGFPEACGLIQDWPDAGRYHAGGRNVSMQDFAGRLMRLGDDDIIGDRPTVDRTGLIGKYDFVLEFSPPLGFFGNSGPQVDDTGPTFLEALREQLGLRLESKIVPVDVLVIDHVEEPTPN